MSGEELELRLASSAPRRLVGLIGRGGLRSGTGLLIPRCASVHTVGMRFAIDVVFVRLAGHQLEVLAVRESLPPWRAARVRRRRLGVPRGEIAAIELAAGEARRLALAPGTSLSVGARRAGRGEVRLAPMSATRMSGAIAGPLIALFLIGGIAFWITTPGIFIGQIWVGVAVLLIVIFALVGRAGARRDRLIREGIHGTATVLGMEQTGVYINEQPQVHLRLRVEAPGITPYDVERKEVVPMLALGSLSQGQLSVAIDPEDHDRVVVDWGAVAAPMTLATPDGRTISVDKPAARAEVSAALRKHQVGTSGEVSIRDNPVVRQEVWSILEHHGYDVSADGRSGAAASTPSPAASPEPERDPVQALEDLKEMRDKKLITEAEFQVKKRELLADL